MLLSEIIIIYLAAAAPFGVANFLQRPADVSGTRSLLYATGAALLWPLILLSRPLAEKKLSLRELHAPEQNASLSRELQIDEAQRALLSVLYQTEDLARNISSSNTEATRESVRAVIASVECYVGLSLAAAGTSEEASPRETELCRIAGREDDDLLIAGRCHQRRNLARLKAHQAQSRLELLHTLAELREVCERIQTATTNQHAARRLFATLLEAYARAIDLLSLFEDERAAMRVARLLDTAGARLLRRSETLQTQVAPESLVHHDTTDNTARKDKPCTTSITHTTAPQTQLSPTQTTIRT
ncbi:MAG: hypothetical protein LC747_05980, partial [Acidobacteria bacterium]|nr:hypothetical protein [Acidobacteriota bacterium]